MKKIIFILLITALPFSMAQAQGKGFKGVVNNIETQYQVKKTGIPLLGVVNFFVKVTRPKGLKSIKLAVFENVNLREFPEESFVDSMMSDAYSKDKHCWRRTIVVNSHEAKAEKVIVYFRPSGKKDFEVAVFTFENHEIVLVQAKLSLRAAAGFLREPKGNGVSRGHSE